MSAWWARPCYFIVIISHVITDFRGHLSPLNCTPSPIVCSFLRQHQPDTRYSTINCGSIIFHGASILASICQIRQLGRRPNPHVDRLQTPSTNTYIFTHTTCPRFPLPCTQPSTETPSDTLAVTLERYGRICCNTVARMASRTLWVKRAEVWYIL